MGNEKTVMLTGLPFDTTEHGLYKLLSPFGAIAPGGVKVTLNVDGTSKGNAMVNFNELEAATQAITALNKCMLPDGKLLILRRFTDGQKVQQGQAKPFGP